MAEIATVTAEIDIWRTANLLLKHHGAQARPRAAQRADEVMDLGDVEGAAVWQRILTAIEVLQDTGPPSGETALH